MFKKFKNLFLALTLSVFTIGCSSSKVNEVKIKIAGKVQVAVEKELKEAYDGLQVVGVDCSLEAEEIGNKVHNKVEDFLKVEDVERKSILASALVPKLCFLVVGEFLPKLIRGSDGNDYACLRHLGADKFKKLGDAFCSGLEL